MSASKVKHVVLVLIFLANFLAVGHTSTVLVSSREDLPFVIPEDFVQVEAVHKIGPADGPWVIHVQDPHCVIEAQKNIQQFISFLEKNYGLKYVYLEGGQGKLQLALQRNFSSESEKRTFLEEYLNQGRVSGSELAFILNENKGNYFGIENPALYEANRQMMIRVLTSRQKRDEVIQELESCLETYGNEAYGPVKGLEFFEAAESIQLLKRASHLEMESKDYYRFKWLCHNLFLEGTQTSLFRKLPLSPEFWANFKQLFETVMKFYEFAVKRDQAMSENVLNRLREDRAPLAVVVTGGFHTEGINQNLALGGVSIVVVTPKYSTVKGRENYAALLMKSE